jgi:RNA polymerase sigma-B factor
VPTNAERRSAERSARAARTEELLTLARASDDADERERLLDEVILVNRGVAVSVAARYRTRGADQGDLEQAAMEGLVKAVHGFDATIRPELLTYAVPKMRGEVLRWFRDQSWTVRPPRRLQELQWRVGHSVDALSQELGRAPSTAEVSADLDEDVTEVGEAMSAQRGSASLDQEVDGTDGLTLADTLADTSRTPSSADVDELVTLAPVVRRLGERDQRILYLRFFEEHSQSEIGERIGVTQMQVSRLLERILRTLRSELSDADAPPA